jgi:hypothetical protein
VSTTQVSRPLTCESAVTLAEHGGGGPAVRSHAHLGGDRRDLPGVADGGQRERVGAGRRARSLHRELASALATMGADAGGDVVDRARLALARLRSTEHRSE